MKHHVLIIGSGIAGVSAALHCASSPFVHVTLITRFENPLESNSYYAQGGIIGPTYNFYEDGEGLEKDIIRAGSEINNERAVQYLIEKGPSAIQSLLQEKAHVPFDPDMAREGGHSVARVMHVKDHTGKTIMESLMPLVLASDNITILSSAIAFDLIVENLECVGAKVFFPKTNTIFSLFANDVILATGGIGQTYASTTNPFGAQGDGLAMAYRAGVSFQDLEYVQFHPTVLFEEGVQKALISEAVRGEGGILRNHANEAFMNRYNPEWKDLAPRDEVSRAIFFEMQKEKVPYQYLDIANVLSATEIQHAFPSIYQTCLEKNIDITKEKIPVSPGAHYHCGGISVDTNGQTSLPHLFAIGEVSATGLHGANRLASTSLLEGLVWGTFLDIPYSSSYRNTKEQIVQSSYDSIPSEKTAMLIQQVQNTMWEHVGLVRTQEGLQHAVSLLSSLVSECEQWMNQYTINEDLLRARSLSQTGWLIATAALQNPTSKGCHYRIS